MRAVVVMLVAACGGGAKKPVAPGPAEDASSYKRLELPGFSIEVPRGFADAPAGQTYHSGKIELGDELRSLILTWQVGAIGTPDELRMMFGAAMSPDQHPEVGAVKTIQVGGNAATQLDATVDGRAVLFVQIGCGKRNIFVTATGPAGVVAFRDHLISSFRCKPDATAEAVASDISVPVAIDDRGALAGFRLMETSSMESDKFAITNDRTTLGFLAVTSGQDGFETVSASFILTLKHMMNAEWTSTRLESRRAFGAPRPFQHGKLVIGGETVNAVFTYWKCGYKGVVGFGMAVDGGEDAAAADLLAKMRCAKPNEGRLPVAH